MWWLNFSIAFAARSGAETALPCDVNPALLASLPLVRRNDRGTPFNTAPDRPGNLDPNDLSACRVGEIADRKAGRRRRKTGQFRATVKILRLLGRIVPALAILIHLLE